MVRPSTQMSMFHFGARRAPGARRRSRGEEFRRVRKSHTKMLLECVREGEGETGDDGREERETGSVCVHASS